MSLLQAEILHAAADSPETTHKLYAVTLITSFSPVPTDKMAKDFPHHTLYQKKSTVFGKELYLVRLGFFPSFATAAAMKDQLVPHYPGAWPTEVPAAEQASARGVEVAALDETNRGSPTASRRPVRTGRVAAGADIAAGPDKSANGDRVAVPIAVETGAAPSPAAGSLPQGTETVNQAGVLLAQGRDLITSGKYLPAIQILERLLTLPHNRFTEDGIEYIGVARERLGQFEMARERYATYLRRNPDTEGARRVRQRLASLSGIATPAATTWRPERDRSVPVTSLSGSLSQRYVRATATTAASDPAVTPPVNDQSGDTQRSLINYLDLTALYQGGDYNNRIVLRDQYTYRWRDTADDDHRLSAAYLELKDRKHDLGARLGRQPGNTGGVLGIFDGASASYQPYPLWRLTGSTGVPSVSEIDARRYFYSVSADVGPLAQHWYGGIYYVYQFVEGVEDRNAVGVELRYLAPRQSVYTLFDYDFGFSALNIAMLQANWRTESNTRFNLLVDHRKSPVLQATNVLIGATVPRSYSELSLIYTSEQLREMAKLRTPESNYYDFSVTHPVSEKLQLGAGFNLYSISESAATVLAPAVPATGNIHIYSLRAIGTGFLFGKDISVLILSRTDGETLQGHGITLTDKLIFQGRWSVEPGLRLARQYASSPVSAEVENSLVAPSVRLEYRWKQSMVFDTEYGQDRNHYKDSGSGLETLSKSRHFSMGYRWYF